jgi:hypothetical protein
MACQTYQHLPLDTATPHIRLLKLLPGHEDDDIKLELENVQLDNDKLQYDAISYTWGPEQPLQVVKIANKSLLLRTNIWQFFKHCRRTKITVNKLWVDSICINQEDPAERNSQVRCMTEIFAKAGHVLVWLGKDVSCLPLMSTVTERMPVNGAQSQDYEEEFFRKLSKDSQTKIGVDILQDFVKILHSMYWWRLWIVQEICLNSRTYIITKNRLLDLSFLLRLEGWIYSSTLKSPNIPELPFETVNAHLIHLRKSLIPGYSLETVDVHLIHLRRVLGLVKKAYKNKLPQTLRTLVNHMGQQLCQDPKDMIYGMLGLLSKEASSKISVNYTSPVEDLFLQAFLCLIEEEILYGKPNSSSLTCVIRDLLKTLKLTPLAVALYIETQDTRHPIHVQHITIDRVHQFTFLYPCTKAGRTPFVPCQHPPSDMSLDEELAHEPDAMFLDHPFIDEDAIYHQTIGCDFTLAECRNASVLCCDFDYDIRLSWTRFATDKSKSHLTVIKRSRDDDFDRYRPVNLPIDVAMALENRVNSICEFSDVWRVSKENQDIPIVCTVRELMYLLDWRAEDEI